MSERTRLNLSTPRLILAVIAAVVVWISGLMLYMPAAAEHLAPVGGVLGVGGIAALAGWRLRHQPGAAYLISVLTIAAVTPAYFLFRPFIPGSEFFFSLAIIAISAQWGNGPGVVTAILAALGYGVVNQFPPGETGNFTGVLALGGFFLASAHIVSALTRQRQKNLQAYARLSGELEHTYEASLGALTAALETRDRETEGHSQRVTALAIALAGELKLPPEQLRWVRWGALLHDVGKIGVPDHILRKAGPPTEEEWAQLRRHPQIGYDMLKAISFLQPALEIVRHHHERYDGGGYPAGLAGEAIPLSARLFTVVDTFDAMTSDRPYRKGRAPEEALAEIRREAGQQFDPRIVRAFEQLQTQKTG